MEAFVYMTMKKVKLELTVEQLFFLLKKHQAFNKKRYCLRKWFLDKGISITKTLQKALEKTTTSEERGALGAKWKKVWQRYLVEREKGSHPPKPKESNVVKKGKIVSWHAD
jgi:hypothetical protein